MAAVEVGPERVEEDELRVGRLPQQEVARPVITGAADEQVDVGHVRLVEEPGDGVLVDLRGVEPDIPDVDLFVRSSGENRTSNFLLWQSAYAEFVFLDTLWPDFDRRHLWAACQEFAARQRRFGSA